MLAMFDYFEISGSFLILNLNFVKCFVNLCRNIPLVTTRLLVHTLYRLQYIGMLWSVHDVTLGRVPVT